MKKILSIAFGLVLTFGLTACETENISNSENPARIDLPDIVNPQNPTIPKDCVSWFDGCNTCGVENGKLTMCTMMYCETPAEPYCQKFSGDKKRPSNNLNPDKPISMEIPPLTTPEDPIICTEQYEPVCGKPYLCLVAKFTQGHILPECEFGKTYSNQCFLKAEKAIYIHDGECKNSRENPTNPVACTSEAKICPNGSSVGRVGPNCEFAPCASYHNSTEIPANCINWFDGCNNCLVGENGLLACTKMYCPENRGEPKCTKFKE